MVNGSTSGSAFGNLPDVMVAELLERSSGISSSLTGRLSELSERRDSMRQRAVADCIINELPELTRELDGLTVVAVDGSCCVERMAGVEIYAAGAVRVTGFGGSVDPKPPDFAIEVHAVDALADGARLNQALMSFLECELVSSATTDLVLLDGAISSIVIGAGFALRSADDKWDALSRSMSSKWSDVVRDAIPSLLQSSCVVSIPKRSTAANEFARFTQVFGGRESDMSGLATANLILDGGEYSEPMKLPTEGLGLGDTPLTSEYVGYLNLLFEDLRVVYFRPRDWSPAYRIEVSVGVADDCELLERQLALIQAQVVNPSMREPYPVYLADRFVRSLSQGMSAVVAAVRSDVTGKVDDDELASRFLSYSRSEPFREVDDE